jgi:hypothetical protein
MAALEFFQKPARLAIHSARHKTANWLANARDAGADS